MCPSTRIQRSASLLEAAEVIAFQTAIEDAVVKGDSAFLESDR